MVKIDNFSLGVVGIGGRKYRIRDVIIFPDGTVKRRKLSRWIFSHHSIRKEEIAELAAAGAEAVVVGTGAFPWAKLSREARNYTSEAYLELADLPSAEAIQKFNQLADVGRSVGAIIHIMC